MEYAIGFLLGVVVTMGVGYFVAVHLDWLRF